MKLSEVVRGQVAELFGRFRQATALSAEERQAVAGERQEYASKLTALLSEIERVTEARVVEELRRILGEMRSDSSLVKLPPPEEVARRVESAALAKAEKPYCPVCERFGGMPWASDREPGARARGEFAVGPEWWCAGHYGVLSWYSWRQQSHETGKTFRLPPPELLPAGTRRATRDPREYLEYTDGALMPDHVVYIREHLERSTGRAILSVPRV